MPQHIDIGSPTLYIFFSIAVAIMICIDMLALKKTGNHQVSLKEAGIWSAIWVSVALTFNLWLWWHLKNTSIEGVSAELQNTFANKVALDFLTGYLIEKALSVDNIFVFLMIFSYFKVPAKYQRRVLVYGIVSAIILRIIMILIGSALISRFDWVLYIFGALLIYTGITMVKKSEEDEDLENSFILKSLRRILPVTPNYHEERFFVPRESMKGEKFKLIATPLFLVLMMINITDVVFAVDSVPAIFAITTDPFVVMTSNVFAILGLRAMYFLLADMADRFHLLNYGLAVILMFIGTKMLIIKWMHIPTFISLGFVLVVLVCSIVLSLYVKKKEKTVH